MTITQTVLIIELAAGGAGGALGPGPAKYVNAFLRSPKPSAHLKNPYQCNPSPTKGKTMPASFPLSLVANKGLA